MINYDSILSAFDGKPTLLQWLKMVKKALDESILKNVDITQNGEKVVFSFNFEDGTSISTPEVTLPNSKLYMHNITITKVDYFINGKLTFKIISARSTPYTRSEISAEFYKRYSYESIFQIGAPPKSYNVESFSIGSNNQLSYYNSYPYSKNDVSFKTIDETYDFSDSVYEL